MKALPSRRSWGVIHAWRRRSISSGDPHSSSGPSSSSKPDASQSAVHPAMRGRPEELSDSEEGSNNAAREKKRWGQQLAWLSGILEPALNLYHKALPPGKSEGNAGPPSTRSLVDIAACLHRSNYGMQQWGLGDLTLGLYLLSLRHAAEGAVDVVEGVQVKSDVLVEDFIYYVELAKGAYLKNEAALARISMLKESNVVKFVDKASVMRPAYYIGLDHRAQTVILGIRGTQSIHDLITDLASHGEEEIFNEGNAHFGTAQAARWFFHNEVQTLRKCLQENMGYGLRIVGHSLGGATASLLAMMLHKRSVELLGIPPEQVAAVGIATPPCVSKSLAVECAGYVTTLALQYDVIPRMSAAALERLRDEILLLDWMNAFKEEENRTGLLDMVASTLQAISSVQEAARRYAIYAKLRGLSDEPKQEATPQNPKNQIMEKDESSKSEATKTVKEHEELYSPGILYHLCGRASMKDQHGDSAAQGCSLWLVNRDARFSRIVLTGSMLSDHKCDSHYYALRDVLKSLPRSERRSPLPSVRDNTLNDK
ncbi:sn1-specific diacylglycerol lipase beta [Selaginella moellendorffii]|uniref:sn1-specific diacylglycerol lipase beta n=1 Tax=Selaginella moellendorffii TaxID=88036 RepID=UPI000D1C84BD|nr:sn1-specific diacylglycerol lipase beta [Selaginella moellendorffii]|eukprot:XP_024517736.1 sn1-specific diacylglycerol lipase beta [Selaginella moellendorffii]